jgi:HKD family nuclease
MATLKFVLQGFTASTHVDVLRQAFDLPNIERVLVSVAFVTEGGVEKIEPHLRPHASQATIFAGIRNDSTTYQGLARLHGLVGQLYTVDTGMRARIFHPKLYLVRGSERARLVIGSANLTLAGLNNNIEAGMLLDFDLANAEDEALIDHIETLFTASSTDYPENVVKVGSIAELDEMLATNRLVDERNALRDSNASDPIDSEGDNDDDDVDGINESKGVPRIKLKVKPLLSGGTGSKLLASFFKRRNASTEGDDFVTSAKIEDKTNGFGSAFDVNEDSPAVVQSKVPEVPQGLDTTPTISSGTTAGGVEFQAEDAPSFPLNYYFRPKKRRRGDGPRLRAARAKAEAIRQGKKWYRTGEPCIYGHYSDRLVSNGKCRECNRLDCERSNRLGLYR